MSRGLFGIVRAQAVASGLALMVSVLACGEPKQTSDAAGDGHDHGDHDHDIPQRNDAGAGESDGGAEDLLRLPPGFPEPIVPDDNPLTGPKIALGRRLFYDKRLSENGRQSCATCHEQVRAFTDGRAQSVGSTGQVHPRSSMSLANVAYLSVLTWGNSVMDTLERQALVPMFGTEPVELGLLDEAALISRLRAEPYYEEAFAVAFPDEEDPVRLKFAVQAMASFQRTLISGRSPYDLWLRGDDTALSSAAKRGFELFNGHPFECFHCHGGFNFADSVRYIGKADAPAQFHNTGLYNIDGQGAYPAPNTGINEVSQRAEDMGRFRAPTLRNIGVTAPYMHDGSIATLAEVVEHYAAGGRTLTTGPYVGVGSDNPYKSELVLGFEATPQQKADLVAFLESLTDGTFLSDPRFADPWR